MIITNQKYSFLFVALLFYSSGYFKIRKFLNDVSEIKILVGIDLGNRAKKAINKGLEINFNDGYNKRAKYNGFILADVVGLGKIIIATIVAKSSTLPMVTAQKR